MRTKRKSARRDPSSSNSSSMPSRCKSKSKSTFPSTRRRGSGTPRTPRKMTSSVNNGCNTQQRKRKGSKNNKDLISSLADDIVTHIVSFMDLKEAAKTSALSKRWRYVWGNLPDCYNFDASEMPWSRLESYDNQQYESKLRSFVRYVTQVVSSSPAQNISRFRARVPLDVNYKDDLQTWMNFVMGRSVKELELNLRGGAYNGEYERGKTPVYLGPFGCYEQSPSAKTLVSLSLIALHIERCFLDSVLLNLPNLERLTMRHVDRSLHNNIRVVGPSLKLRYLEISGCSGLGALEISASNLISFIYSPHGVNEDVKFISVPLLDEVSFGGNYAVRLIHNFQPISGFSSQLAKLALCRINQFLGISHSLIEFPRFRKLKQLELKMLSSYYMNLPFLTNFIHARPVLHKFQLQCKSRFNTGISPVGNVNGFDTVLSKLHHHLNTFEMVGFLGCEVDIELVLYLARFSVLLDKVILHPLLAKDYFGKTKEESSREQAKLLRNQLPATVQLEIL
ncbi:hypothetical protein Cgig2_007312 [Carnegiea gigantea]|uniref:F-box domain-containing protein n=1 Tax=Carnegiea gigantea TaxID=171969 RepID=A0A9Q1QRU7_9CARY|nr:hypothetical protein Cgig2_007312 [Carnegiea gigantea]